MNTLAGTWRSDHIPPLVDPFGCSVSYLRVTDRCDFRCTSCMSENMVLSLEDQQPRPFRST